MSSEYPVDGDPEEMPLNDSPEAAIEALQQRHYAAAPSPDAGANLAEAFKRGFAWRAAEATDESSGLPPLYPFKLH